MNAVIFYSNTGQSRAIAEYFSNQLGYALVDIDDETEYHYKNLVVVFPIYSQNIPKAVEDFLKKTTIDNLTVIATYGKMCYGNALYEIQKKYQKSVVAGAYIPTKHAFTNDDYAFCDFDKLMLIVEKIKNPSPIQIPRQYKNPFANMFPNLRSRMGLAIQKNSNCTGCNLCAECCPLGAMESGVPNGKCIRCLRCVALCPQKALTIKLRLPLRLYLRKQKVNKIVIYV